MTDIWGVLEYGPIVAQDAELGFLVTINGSCLNLWSLPIGKKRHRIAGALREFRTSWECVDIRSFPTANGLYTVTVADAMGMGEKWLEEIKQEMSNG